MENTPKIPDEKGIIDVILKLSEALEMQNQNEDNGQSIAFVRLNKNFLTEQEQRIVITFHDSIADRKAGKDIPDAPISFNRYDIDVNALNEFTKHFKDAQVEVEKQPGSTTTYSFPSFKVLAR